MVIVKLMGGLGNQMFQYAAARRLAYKHNTELKLDLSFLESCQSGYTPRSYELCHFAIHAEIASPREVTDITGGGDSLLKATLERFRQAAGLARGCRSRYSESHFHFDPAVLDLPDNIFLDGYWHSEQYFKDIEDVIRKEIVVKYPLERKNQVLASEILSVNSVSLHFRRGDYVKDTATNLYHGTCALSYYNKSIAEIAEKVKDPHFYIFSDDICWIRDNVNISFPLKIVDHNGYDAAYEDIRLMSLCKHNIIANSSFSWWGAWLNSNKDKIVLAPEKWFHFNDVDTGDLLPEKWVKVSE